MNIYPALLNSDNPMETARKIVAPICKNKLNEHILGCNQCGFNFNKTQVVGNPLANILIINEPKKNNAKNDKIFKKIIEKSKINHEELFIINSINCICDKTPTSQMKNNCKHFIDYTIDFVRPKIIISMGSVSLNQYCPDTPLNEEVLTKSFYFNGIPTYVTYSVDYLLSIIEKCGEEESVKIQKSILETFKKAKNHLKLISK